jgi:hypothetical protein
MREGTDMPSFLVSCVTAIVIAIGAALVLNSVQKPADTAFHSKTGVRLPPADHRT